MRVSKLLHLTQYPFLGSFSYRNRVKYYPLGASEQPHPNQYLSLNQNQKPKTNPNPNPKPSLKRLQ